MRALSRIRCANPFAVDLAADDVMTAWNYPVLAMKSKLSAAGARKIIRQVAHGWHAICTSFRISWKAHDRLCVAPLTKLGQPMGTWCPEKFFDFFLGVGCEIR